MPRDPSRCELYAAGFGPKGGRGEDNAHKVRARGEKGGKRVGAEVGEREPGPRWGRSEGGEEVKDEAGWKRMKKRRNKKEKYENVRRRRSTNRRRNPEERATEGMEYDIMQRRKKKRKAAVRKDRLVVGEGDERGRFKAAWTLSSDVRL